MCSIQFHLIAVLRIFHAFVHNNWLSSWITFIFSAYNRVINKWQRTKALKTSLSLDNPWHLVNNLPPLPNAAECLSTKINHKLKKTQKGQTTHIKPQWSPYCPGGNPGDAAVELQRELLLMTLESASWSSETAHCGHTTLMFIQSSLPQPWLIQMGHIRCRRISARLGFGVSDSIVL